ncbi:MULTISPECIES: type VII toxin-antitoxin system MntA family adenylyltransferase antitoxin [Clostridium]|uniref:type VII toxin-antitoxin system MntA family adenylyltransferase antitoxin n=1 Tax=Clostridium TaxID=1485 RepID=UPI000827113F|nr:MULTISPECIES: nucleotidyltransferase domain-containing protein [Clostridium]PJI08547.1 nucleotidyltransferase domain-containing protein [Clostridium sp. CT7]
MPLSSLNKEAVKDIIDILTKNVKPTLIYIFGSAARNELREDSDIDIAYLSNTVLSNYEIFMLANHIADIIKRDVDLINLKNASTVFKAQIVGNGKVVYCSDNTKRMYFEMYAFKDYALLNEERKDILDGIKKRGNIYG